LKLDVYKAALDKLLVEKELDTEKAKLDILSEKYSMAEARYKEGKITENDLNDAKYALDAKRLMCRELKKVLRQRSLNLKDC